MYQNFMGMSTKEVYSAFGIDYDPATGKIYAPEFGRIPELLINGNDKIGRGIWHFSTLAGKKLYSIAIENANGIEKKYEVMGTCPCTCDKCYGLTGHYLQDDAKKSNGRKTFLAYNHLEFVRRAILAQIIARKIKFVRIHATGDFFSAEYVAMWQDIISRNPDTRFWTYTKNRDAEMAFDSLENANIVRSLIPGCGFNFGDGEHLLKCLATLESMGETPYFCRCGIDKDQHCTNCKGCSVNRYVLFVKHSDREYKFENDPHRDEIVRIIENQPMP